MQAEYEYLLANFAALQSQQSNLDQSKRRENEKFGNEFKKFKQWMVANRASLVESARMACALMETNQETLTSSGVFSSKVFLVDVITSWACAWGEHLSSSYDARGHFLVLQLQSLKRRIIDFLHSMATVVNVFTIEDVEKEIVYLKFPPRFSPLNVVRSTEVFQWAPEGTGSFREMLVKLTSENEAHQLRHENSKAMLEELERQLQTAKAEISKLQHSALKSDNTMHANSVSN